MVFPGIVGPGEEPNKGHQLSRQGSLQKTSGGGGRAIFS